MNVPTTEWTELEEPAYSNFNHLLDLDVQRLLEADPRCFARHAAWNFNGLVWFADGVWHDQVSVFRKTVGTVSGPQLDEVIAEVNRRWGTA